MRSSQARCRTEQTVSAFSIGGKAVLAAVVVAAIALSAGCRQAAFVHGVETKRTPWTHTRFINNPDEFQFVIVPDRTGATRNGVFPAAMKKVNLLRPEFVITVGDLIEGYVKTEEEVLAQWEEFDRELRLLDAPFFYVPGNHDLTSKGEADMKAIWNNRYGKLYYYFVYKDVLFLCLNAQDYIGVKGAKRSWGVGLMPEQVQWAQQVLRDHPDVRWTCVFLHQNVWRIENSGWEEIEQVLNTRDYTVFYGHWHAYAKSMRHGRKHFSLATAGGISPLRGPEFGTFDEVVWVTMTKEGPVIANLALDGIMDEDVVPPEKAIEWNDTAYVRNLTAFSFDESQSSEKNLVFRLALTNRFEQELQYNLAWNNADSNWRVAPEKARGVVAPGQEKMLAFRAERVAVDRGFPVCSTKTTVGDKEVTANLPIEALVRRQVLSRPMAKAGFFNRPPTIDGKLNDPAWLKAGKIEGFEKAFGGKADVKTTAFVGYDQNNLYIAFLCDEPHMGGLRATAKHWGYIHKEDFVEVAFDVNRDRKTHLYLRTNALGTVDNGGFWKDKARRFRIKPSVKCGIGDSAWAVEMAIPWKDIADAPPKTGASIGLFLARIRKQTGEVQHFPALYKTSHYPTERETAMFADLRLEPQE